VYFTGLAAKGFSRETSDELVGRVDELLLVDGSRAAETHEG